MVAVFKSNACSRIFAWAPAYLRSLADAREHRAHQDAAWNEQYDTYLELANAHAAALTLAAGLRAASKTADPDASRLLTDLCLLSALESVHESSGWLLANKLLTPAQVLEIPGDCGRSGSCGAGGGDDDEQDQVPVLGAAQGVSLDAAWSLSPVLGAVVDVDLEPVRSCVAE